MKSCEEKNSNRPVLALNRQRFESADLDGRCGVCLPHGRDHVDSDGRKKFKKP